MTTKEGTMKVLAAKQWECEQARNKSSALPDEEHSGWCGIVWDNILCWNKTRPGTVASLPCPGYIPQFNTAEFAERRCTENGTWWVNPIHNTTWTNFSKCVFPPLDITSHADHADNLILLYTIGYSISLASLVVAVIIMLYWRRLHCKSNTLHINLFVAFILRASMSFMKDRLFVGGLGLPQDVKEGEGGKLIFIQEGLHWECRTLSVLFMFAISASQTWMLMEGLYLYLLVHKTMTTERLGVRPYIILGWVLPWTFLIPWIVVKSVFENTFCWNMQENPAYFWIMKGPWTAIVVINFFFFLDIIRVLVTKVRNNQRHVGRSQYRKFGKFILVLIPLFGIMYIVMNVAFPSEVHGEEYNVVYLYIEMGYNSFQGFILALLFCFLNEDVHSEMRRSWQRHRSRRYNSNVFKRSVAQSSWHKASRSSGTHSPAIHRDFHSEGTKKVSVQQLQKPCLNHTLSTQTYLSTAVSIDGESGNGSVIKSLPRTNNGSSKSSRKFLNSFKNKEHPLEVPVKTSLGNKGFLGRSTNNGYDSEIITSGEASRPLRTSFD